MTSLSHVRSVKNHKLIIGGSLATVLMLSAVFADVVAPYSYSEPIYADAGQFPSVKHLMGTDTLGRDLFSRIVFGTRVSLGIGIGVQALALFIGVPLGAAAGFHGGKVDYVVTRLLDITQAFPYLLLVILIMVTIGSGLPNVFLALSLTWTSQNQEGFDLC